MADPKVDLRTKVWSLEKDLLVCNLQSKNSSDLIKVEANISGLTFYVDSASKVKGETPVTLRVKSSELINAIPNTADDGKLYLAVFSYPSHFPKKSKRKCVCFKLMFDTLEDLEEWETVIKYLTRLDVNREPVEVNQDSKVLILINPNSGPGRAYDIFRKHVVPVLSQAGTNYEVLITQWMNHARDVMETLPLSTYRAVAAVGGDGLLFEVMNGLGRRPDWETALRMPVCVIPGGSGNGLAKSLAHWRKECDRESGSKTGSVLLASLNLARGTPRPMDLVKIHTCDGMRLFSFLTFGLGLLSDIDIESEKLRMLGETRFTVYAVAKVVSLRKYRVRVAFKRASGITPCTQPSRPILHRSKTVQEDYNSPSPAVPELVRSQSTDEAAMSELHTKNADDSTSSASSAEDASSCVTEAMSGTQSKEVNIDWCEEAATYQEKIPSPEVGRRKKKTSTRKGDYSYLSECEENSQNVEMEVEADVCEILKQAVPDDWETIEGEFITVYVTYQTHLSKSMAMYPHTTPDDGLMWIFLLPSTMTRVSVTKFLLSIETSTHLNIPGVEIIPVTAVRLTPLDSSGILTVDGEVVPYGPLHAEMLPHQGRVLVR